MLLHLGFKETARKYMYKHSPNLSWFFCLYLCISPTSLPSFHCCLSSTYLWKNVNMNYSDYEVKFPLKSNPSVPLQIVTNRSNISFHGVYGSMEVHNWTTDCGPQLWTTDCGPQLWTTDRGPQLWTEMVIREALSLFITSCVDIGNIISSRSNK